MGCLILVLIVVCWFIMPWPVALLLTICGLFVASRMADNNRRR